MNACMHTGVCSLVCVCFVAGWVWELFVKAVCVCVCVCVYYCVNLWANNVCVHINVCMHFFPLLCFPLSPFMACKCLPPHQKELLTVCVCVFNAHAYARLSLRLDLCAAYVCVWLHKATAHVCHSVWVVWVLSFTRPVYICVYLCVCVSVCERVGGMCTEVEMSGCLFFFSD